MPASALLLVMVTDERGEPIARARVRLQEIEPHTRAARAYDLDYLPDQALYRSPAVPLGDYTLSVEADHFMPERRQVQLQRLEQYERVALGQEGTPYYVLDGRKHYFQQEAGQLALLISPRESRADRRSLFLRRHRAIDTYRWDQKEEITADDHLILDQDRLIGADVGEELSRLLFEDDEVIDLGPLIHTRSAGPVILSASLLVRVREGVGRDALVKRIEPLNLEVTYQDRYQPRLFGLTARYLIDAGFGSMPETLMQFEEIEHAESQLNASKRPDVPILPGDPLFNLQFHHMITRLPEAWEALDPANTPASFGSADVVVAIQDSGLATGSGGTVITHPEFAGTVSGGNLSGQPGLNNNKVLFTFDFQPLVGTTIVPGNDASTGSHGSRTAGVISASTDGMTGVVGGAANTRLCSYIFNSTSNERDGHAFDFMGGLMPSWTAGSSGYPATQVFPAPFGTGQNPIPGADIINCSHTQPVLHGVHRAALQRITLFGRQRRGVPVFASAGNADSDARTTGQWGEDHNVMRVAGSSFDLLEHEVRMNYSNYAVLLDRTVDFAAPSESQNFAPTVHQAPQMLGFISVDRNTTSGNLATNVASRFPVTNAPGPTLATVQVAAANFAVFSAGDQVILRDTLQPLHAELHTLAAPVAPNSLPLNRAPGYSYTAGQVEIIRLGGTTGYTTTFGGTSAATPQASALAALMLSARPALSWLELRDLMRSTAVPIHLRYRGSRYASAPHFRYRWLDTSTGATIDLIDGDGLLTITGGNKTIISGPLNAGLRLLTLNDTSGINPRQALLIGVETKLNGNHPLAAPDANKINVDRANDFAIGDQLFIGKHSQTVIINAAAAGNTFIWVQSVDGFLPGDHIDLDPGGPNAETVRINSIRRSGSSGTFGPADTGFNISRLDGAGNPIGGGLRNAHVRAEVVESAATWREGPFTINAINANQLTLNAAVTNTHPDDRIVYKANTELKAVIRTLPGNQVEIDPLEFTHPLNVNGVESVRVGGIASYSLGFGYGRLDAFEAVRAAQQYDHSLRDLMLRNHLADDGATTTADQAVHSPDLWVRNDAATTTADLPNYADAPPDDHPKVTVDPPMFAGSGINDLEVDGVCTSATEIRFTIEIDGTNPDTIRWKRDDGAFTHGVAITGATQGLSDGVSIRFAQTTGHTLNDTWLIEARAITDRFLHLRTYNRGSQAFFTASALGTAASRLDVARARLLLCFSDGTPVARFESTAASPGNNDLEVVSPYTGLSPRALYSVEITATAAGGDTYRWHRDGTAQGTVVLTAATLLQPLNDGVQVQFGSHTGHAVGDRWDIYARQADAFLNLDHFWPFDEPTPFDLAATGPIVGTRMLQEFPISGLGATTARIDSATWPEAQRPPTNSPNDPKPARPRRLFALGEVVPHDGPLTGHTCKTNNNIAYRELIFAKFRYTMDEGRQELQQHIDLDALGLGVTQAFRAEVRTTAGFFQAENVRIRLTARRTGQADEVVDYQYNSGMMSWGFDPATPSWARLHPPLEARRPDGSQPPATGEQYDIQFDGEVTVDPAFEEVVLEAQVLSHFRPQVLASAPYPIAVYPKQPLPAGIGAAMKAVLPRPRSHVFADMGTLQAGPAFGPVTTDQFRTGAYFTAPGTVMAYAITKGFVAIQRDPANNDTVNLILRPFRQPIAGFPPIQYVVYRGLALSDFLRGTSGNDAKMLRDQAGASSLIQAIWTDYLALNPGATELPATVMGYDPDNQSGADRIDSIFFTSGSDQQLFLVESGAELGAFATNHSFGLEIVLDEGGYAPDLDYARTSEYLIDLSGLPNASDADQFTRRIRREEVHHFLDPAAFYGLHLHNDGLVEAPGNTTHVDEAIFTEVVDTFPTKHLHYLDIRSANGDSLNFFQNYDDGNGHALQTGTDPANLTAAAYATQSWPLLVIDQSAIVNTTEEHIDLYLQLRVDDNEQPVLYVEHGLLASTSTNGPFIRNDQLRVGSNAWTETIHLQVPAIGGSGNRQGVAWISRLQYGRLANPAPTQPPPPSILPIQHYSDQVFGPIDRDPSWAGASALAWSRIQHSRYVDAEQDLGWKQIMACGLAFQAGTDERVLLFALAQQSDTNSVYDVVATRGLAEGVSQQATFFAEKGLLGNYRLVQDQIDDNGTLIRTLQLDMDPATGFPPTNVLLLGLGKAEFDQLKALSGAGLHTDYQRFIILDNPQAGIDAHGIGFTTYRLGVRGLKSSDATAATEFPSSDMLIYSLDGHAFFSKAFSDAEPLPTAYTRNFEEEKGARLTTAQERRIGSVDTGADQLTITGYDWSSELAVGDQLKIGGSTGNDGQYPVTDVQLNGNDTIITLGGSGLSSSSTPLGSAFTVPKAIEDFFIDKDQEGQLNGLPRLRDLVDGFKNNVAAVADDGQAQTNLMAQVEDAGPKVLDRSRALAEQDRDRATDAERALYWARISMQVALKSHPYCLASLSGRNALSQRLEETSRGYGADLTNAAAGEQKVLITGFDPIQVALDLEASNIAAAVALALHGQSIGSSGKTAHIEGMVFPVRYAPLDAGRVEAIVDPLLSGPQSADMILALNQQPPGVSHIDVERLAARSRGGEADNNFVSFPRRPIGADATHAAFYESNLPIAEFVTGPFGLGQEIYFDESYAAEHPDQHLAHPSTGPTNGNAPSFPLSTLTGDALEGSAGSYLPNELFYRLAHRREAAGSSTLCGLVQLPSPQASDKSVADLIGEIEAMIRRWLDSLP